MTAHALRLRTTIIYSKKKKDEESIVDFVKNVSSYDYDISEKALYI